MLTDPLTRGGLAVPLAGKRGGATPSTPAAAARRRGALSLAQLAPLTRPLEAAAPPGNLRSSSLAASSSGDAFLPPAVVGLSGRWRKDSSASDDMTPACDAVALPWILRKAVGVVKVLELEDTPVHFRTRLKAGGVLDIVETYPWAVDAPEVVHGRRDKRKGGHTGRVERIGPATPGGPPGAAIHVRWGDPYGGTCVDAFTVSPDGRTLVQATEMVMAGSGEVVRYRTVYRREHQRQRG